MLAVMLYEELSARGIAHALEVYPRHQDYVDEFAQGGEIIGIATFGDPAKDGSMGIFRSRNAAERFVAADPFITEGVVVRWRILDWNAAID